jgi:hypothetical protein
LVAVFGNSFQNSKSRFSTVTCRLATRFKMEEEAKAETVIKENPWKNGIENNSRNYAQ